MPDFEEFCLSKLYVTSDDLDPEDVSALFGIPCDKSYRRGEPSYKVRLDGSVTNEPTGLKHRVGMWRRSIDPERKRLWDTEAQLDYWCEFLEQRRSALRILQGQGCEVKIDFHIEEGPVVSLQFSHKLLKRITDLKASLRFGIYDSTSPLFNSTSSKT